MEDDDLHLCNYTGKGMVERKLVQPCTPCLNDVEEMRENWRKQVQILSSVQSTLGSDFTQPNGVTFAHMTTWHYCLDSERVRSGCACCDEIMLSRV